MKHRFKKIASSLFIVSCTMTIGSPALAANSIKDSDTTSAFGTVVQENTNSSTDSNTNDTTTDSSEEFSAHIILTDSERSQILDVENNSITISQILQKNGFNPDNFRTSTDEPINDSNLLKNGETLSLFKSEISGESSVISLKAPTEKKETDSLYKGEEKVETEGKDGKAIKTIVHTKSLASDKSINKLAKADNTKDTSEEKLTVLETPVTEVILVGTKERPVEITSVRSNTSSTATTETTNTNAASRSTVRDSADVASASSSVIDLVKAQVGKPYVWGAAGPNSFDCSGLVYWIYATNGGKSIPRTAYAQGMAATPVSAENIQPGDVLWTSYHIGIYVGGGQVIHASNPNDGVKYTPLSYFLNNGFKIGRL